MSIPVFVPPPTPAVSLEQPFSVYVSNIPTTCSEKKMVLLFETMGGYHGFKGVTDPITGNCGSFGVVTYVESAACRRAYNCLNGLELDGKALKLKMDSATQERLASSEVQRKAFLLQLPDEPGDCSGTGEEAASRSPRQVELERRKHEDEAARTALDEFLRANNFSPQASRSSIGGAGNGDSGVIDEKRERALKRKRGAQDGRLASELERFKRKQTREERRKWVEHCVEEYFGKVDDQFVSYLFKLSPSDLVPGSHHYKDLKLVFLKDVDAFLSRLSSPPKAA